MTGRLLGIARHDRPRGPMETLDHARVTREAGIAGDYRGALKPGRNRRQVTLMRAEDWMAATVELGVPVEWQARRANLLVEGLDWPPAPGTTLRIGGDVVLEVTGECDPCSRMDELSDGLQRALRPGWRGGAITKVLADGDIRIGDEVMIGSKA